MNKNKILLISLLALIVVSILIYTIQKNYYNPQYKTITRKIFKSDKFSKKELAERLRIINSLPEKPNVLFIILDDQNDWLNFLRKEQVSHTPHMNQLAKKSVNFINAHVPSTQCNPSRASILTGLAPYTTGIYHNLSPSDAIIRRDKLTTIMQSFSSDGYKVIGVGKIFHERQKMNDHFDYYFDSKDIKADSEDFFDYKTRLKDETDSFDYQNAQRVRSILKQKHTEPFFLAFGTHDPHPVWQSSQKYFNLYPLADVPVPITEKPQGISLPEEDKADLRIFRRLKERNQLQKAIRAYLSTVSQVDARIGEIMEALESSEYKDNTIVILLSDHGFHLGSKERIGKKTLWEPATHIPFLIRIPGLSHGELCAKPVSVIDTFPTLIELCKLSPVEGLDGKSLMPMIADPGIYYREPILATSGYKNHAVRKKYWKYISYIDGSEELYDLLNDPNELNNLAEKTKHQELKLELAEYLPEFNKEPLPDSFNIVKWIAYTDQDSGFYVDSQKVHKKKFSEFEDITFNKEEQKLPITEISFNTAQSYCQSQGKRLPRYQEWKLITNKTIHYSTEVLPEKNRGIKIDKIKSLPANKHGIYDTEDNAWEWLESSSGKAIIIETSIQQDVFAYNADKDFKAKYIGFRCVADAF
jgi:arylsulfatase A-like enzyme